MEFDLENPLENLHSDAVSYLFLIESDHTPSQNHSHTHKPKDLDISIRGELVSLISQVSAKTLIVVEKNNFFFLKHNLSVRWLALFSCPAFWIRLCLILLPTIWIGS